MADLGPVHTPEPHRTHVRHAGAGADSVLERVPLRPDPHHGRYADGPRASRGVPQLRRYQLGEPHRGRGHRHLADRDLRAADSPIYGTRLDLRWRQVTTRAWTLLTGSAVMTTFNVAV